jgi:hypothetical protein
MNIETKYEPSDEVWYFKDSAPTMTEVKSIHIKIEKLLKTNILIKYELLREQKLIHESSIFKTQQELYVSLEGK